MLRSIYMPQDGSRSFPELLSLAVHEFRTPAGVIAGYLRMLRRDTEHPLSERQEKIVSEAERSCARVVALIDELSEIAKLDGSPEATLARQPFDLFDAVREVAAGVHEVDDREAVLEVRGEAAGAHMVGDPSRVRTALSAIFRAIVRERAAAGTIAVSCHIDAHDGRRAAVVVVADESRVQAAYEAARVPFDEKRGGLGLALPIGRRVIEAHGGHLLSPAIEEGRGIAVIVIPIPEQGA